MGGSSKHAVHTVDAVAKKREMNWELITMRDGDENILQYDNIAFIIYIKNHVSLTLTHF